MKRILYAASLALAVLLIPACGGGGSGSASTANQTQDGGLAPESITADMILTPNGNDVGGRILLQRQEGYDRVAYFSSERDANGNYVDGDFETGSSTYRGNYIYTKCGPNVAELRVENLRAESGDTADDCIWTIYGYLTFKDEMTVSFSGTQTLIDSHHFEDMDGGHNENHNDPMGFAGEGENHFPGVQHNDGGTRNFNSVIYTYSMNN